ncbi:hypothetical protein B0T20DRAFT_18513 [Sordaria brevicollis]|uniref:Secreted protein n=1 Tax=Sordaria brevicollis TaxID=83679 RepID=A0AAE0PNA0_SORBR|nr:hypothetical protein B0T20DRAFT_18513 [Sordaria brevicollis]
MFIAGMILILLTMALFPLPSHSTTLVGYGRGTNRELSCDVHTIPTARKELPYSRNPFFSTSKQTSLMLPGYQDQASHMHQSQKNNTESTPGVEQKKTKEKKQGIFSHTSASWPSWLAAKPPNFSEKERAYLKLV